MARPKLEIDWERVIDYLKLGATLQDCANFLNVGENTLRRGCKKEFNCDFGTLIKKSQETTKISVRGALMQKVASGDTSAIIYANKTIGGLIEAKDEKLIAIKEKELEKYKEVKEVVNDLMIEGLAGLANNLDEYNQNETKR